MRFSISFFFSDEFSRPKDDKVGVYDFWLQLRLENSSRASAMPRGRLQRLVRAGTRDIS